MKTINLCNSDKVALVDDEDYDRCMQLRWIFTVGYAHGSGKIDGVTFDIYLHRFILINSIVRGMEVDHIDGNSLNNQKANLRVCYHRQNLCNQKKQLNRLSKYKGVTYDKSREKWKGQLKCHQINISLGYHLTQESAAIAYNIAARKYFQEFANPNIVHIEVNKQIKI